jgi:nucleoside-diphosphate-sugar epimerase
MERLISVFGGHGFVGSRYCELTKNVIINDKYDYEVEPGTTDVVYFISTIDNYGVHVNPQNYIDTNLTTMLRVLESCRKKGATFNFISSWFVYGDVELPAKENSYCDPKGFYSITKRTAEQLIISYCETFKMNYRIFRLGNVLGKTDNKVSKKKNAFQYMVNEIINNRDIELYDNGEVYRDYIHVDDVVSAINLLLNRSNLNEIYNIGNGVKVYLREAMEYVVEKTGSKSLLKSREAADFHKIVQSKDMVLDVSKLKSLGFIPKYTIKEIIHTLI